MHQSVAYRTNLVLELWWDRVHHILQSYEMIGKLHIVRSLTSFVFMLDAKLVLCGNSFSKALNKA